MLPLRCFKSAKQNKLLDSWFVAEEDPALAQAYLAVYNLLEALFAWKKMGYQIISTQTTTAQLLPKSLDLERLLVFLLEPLTSYFVAQRSQAKELINEAIGQAEKRLNLAFGEKVVAHFFAELAEKELSLSELHEVRYASYIRAKIDALLTYIFEKGAEDEKYLDTAITEILTSGGLSFGVLGVTEVVAEKMMEVTTKLNQLNAPLMKESSQAPSNLDDFIEDRSSLSQMQAYLLAAIQGAILNRPSAATFELFLAADLKLQEALKLEIRALHVIRNQKFICNHFPLEEGLALSWRQDLQRLTEVQDNKQRYFTGVLLVVAVYQRLTAKGRGANLRFFEAPSPHKEVDYLLMATLGINPSGMMGAKLKEVLNKSLEEEFTKGEREAFKESLKAYALFPAMAGYLNTEKSLEKSPQLVSSLFSQVSAPSAAHSRPHTSAPSNQKTEMPRPA